MSASSTTAQPTLDPSVLLLDDGELDGVYRQLMRMGADVVRLQGRWIAPIVPRPRDLLVSSIRRTLDMPAFEGATNPGTPPTWVCVHHQDFLPLRARLRDLGVHFLVHSALEAASLYQLLLQLLHAGYERRSRFRLPLGVAVSVHVGGGAGAAQPASLAELSADACRILTSNAIEGSGRAGQGPPVRIVLPRGIGGGEPLALSGRVVRSSPCSSPAGERIHSTVLCFEELEPHTQAALSRIVSGGQIGTRVSPLAERSRAEGAGPSEAGAEARAGESAEQGAGERRHQPRHAYDRRVALLDLRDAGGDVGSDGSALGLDLSLAGVRLLGGPPLAPGSQVTLALAGGRREEPVIVPAEVVREGGGSPGELALRFVRLSDGQRASIEKLLRGLPLAALPDGGPVVLAQIVRSA
jgi:hypothetical protein